MKKLFLFLALAFAFTGSQAQCVTKYFGTATVVVCNDGGIPSMTVAPLADSSGYIVTYDPNGVDYVSPGGNAAEIHDLDGYSCTNCIRPVSAYGYCGSTQGTAYVSFTCSQNPWSYILYPKGITHHLQLVLFMGTDSGGAKHFRYQDFVVTDATGPAPPAPPAIIRQHGNGRIH